MTVAYVFIPLLFKVTLSKPDKVLLLK